MKEHILETWDIHNRINLYLLDAIDESHLNDVSASKGRAVGAQFAHIHNVRLMWLKASAPDLLKSLEKIDDKVGLGHKILRLSLERSSAAVRSMLSNALDENKLKGFKPHPSAFLGYLISHESHHRGQIMLTLKQSGHPVDKKVAFGIWEWGTR